jgi:hypothetical protein
MAEDEKKVVKKEVKYEEKISYDNDSKSTYEQKTSFDGDPKNTLENATDKIKAGAKAVVNKVKDTDRDSESEYERKKLKENVDK